MQRHAFLIAGLGTAACLWFGCGARSSLLAPEPAPEGSGGTANDGGAGGEGGTGGAGGTGGLPDAGPDAQGGYPPVPEVVFAETGAQLFAFDTTNEVMSLVGYFNGCGESVNDIALDRKGRLFGTTTSQVVRIDTTTAACTVLAFGSYPNSLAMVPKGFVDEDDETLVGFEDSTYVRIDRETGELTAIGDLDSGKDLVSSGDLVILPGGEMFLTVKGGSCHDCLVRVDPKTGEMLEMIGSVSYSNVYGLATSTGRGFGFGVAGEVFRIDLMTGDVDPIALKGAPPGASWYGAASAPVGD